jgi:hypothetical protein
MPAALVDDPLIVGERAGRYEAVLVDGICGPTFVCFV